MAPPQIQGAEAGEAIAKFWKLSFPRGHCSTVMLAEVLQQETLKVLGGKDTINRDEFLAEIFGKGLDARMLASHALKARADFLLSMAKATMNTATQAWRDGKSVHASALDPKDDAVWQRILEKIGVAKPAIMNDANFYLKMAAVGFVANEVPYPHAAGSGIRSPVLPMLTPMDQIKTGDMNGLPFPLKTAAPAALSVRPGRSAPACESAAEWEALKMWQTGLAGRPAECRQSMHADKVALVLDVTPWPEKPLNVIDGPCLEPQLEVYKSRQRRGGLPGSWLFEAKQLKADPEYFQQLRFLRGRLHGFALAFELDLTPWPMRPQSVIKDDLLTDEQQRVLTHRAARGQLSAKALAWRRRKVTNPRIFEEIRPTLEKEASLAEMRLRWAKDKADEAKAYDALAERGSQFAVWPVKGSNAWPAVPRVWQTKGDWFRMSHEKRKERSRQAEKMASPPGAPQKLCKSSLPGQPKLKRQRSGGSNLTIDSSWEVVSDCTSDSWQKVGEVEVAPQERIQALRDEISKLKEIQSGIMGDRSHSMGASGKDFGELKSLKAPPTHVRLIIEMLDMCVKGSSAKAFEDFDLGTLPPAHRIKVLKKMAALERLGEEKLGRECGAAVGPFQWLHAKVAVWNAGAGPVKIRKLEQQLEEMLGSHEETKAGKKRRSLSPAEMREEAVRALDCLSKADVVELRSMSKPPLGIDKVVCAVGAILGEKNCNDWKAAVGVLGDAEFMKRLTSVDPSKISRMTQAKAVRFLLDREVHSMHKKSKAAAGLAQWARNVLFIAELDTKDRKKDVKEPTFADSVVALSIARAKLDTLSAGGTIAKLRACGDADSTLPAGVFTALGAVMVLLGEDLPPTWAKAKHMLSSPTFLQRVQSFDADEVSEATLQALFRFIEDSEDHSILGKPFVDFDIVIKPRAAGVLWEWVAAVKQYVEMHRASKPDKAADSDFVSPRLSNRSTQAPTTPVLSSSAGSAPPTPVLKPTDQALRRAQEAIGYLEKGGVGELKSLSQPPQGVKIATEAAMRLLAGSGDAYFADLPEGWKGCQRGLADPRKVIAGMRALPSAILSGAVSRDRFDEAERLLRETDEAQAKSVSVTAGHLMVWTRSMLEYFHAAQAEADKA